jgi:AraC-like DNA-binding protein
LADPGDVQPLALKCKATGASKTHSGENFQDHVGKTLEKWRQQLRLMHAMRLLDEGAKVTHAAMESGYQHAEHIHFDVQKNVRHHPDSVF